MSVTMWMPYTPAEAHRRLKEVDENKAAMAEAMAALKDQVEQERAETESVRSPTTVTKLGGEVFAKPGIKGLVPLSYKGPRQQVFNPEAMQQAEEGE